MYVHIILMINDTRRARTARSSGIEATCAVREMRRRELGRTERNCAALRCTKRKERRRVVRWAGVGTIRQRVPPRYRAENHGQIKHGDSVAVYGESRRLLALWRRVPVHERDFLTAERACAIVN